MTNLNNAKTNTIDETNTNAFSTVASPKFVFTFTSYQLQVLAAINSGCETAAGIREFLSDETEDQAGASARRKTYETIAVFVKCGLCTSERLGRYRTVSIVEEAAVYIDSVLDAAGLFDTDDLAS